MNWSNVTNLISGGGRDRYWGGPPDGGGGGAPAGQFSRYYRCYSANFAFKPEIEKGNKILLPASALQTLARLDVQWPMLFEVNNTDMCKKTHCGVLEFSADEQTCYLPYWMMQNLLLKEGDLVRIQNTSLPKGQYVKLQPVTSDFLQISNPRAVLESALRHFACLTEGDIVEIHYNDKVYEIDITETRPSPAISVIEVDVEVDFAPPKDYVEPEPVKPQSAGVVPDPSQVASEDMVDSEEEEEFALYGGDGHRLDGGRAAEEVLTTNVVAEPWRNRIPGGVRSWNQRYADLVAKGTIKRYTNTVPNGQGFEGRNGGTKLYGGRGHRLD